MVKTTVSPAKKILCVLLCAIFITSAFFYLPSQTARAQTVTKGSRDWRWPVPGANSLTGCFNEARSGSKHNGLDIPAAKGKNVIAAYGGRVITAKNSCTHNYGKKSSCACGSYGNYVEIESTYKGTVYRVIYAHLTSAGVKAGATVTAGQTIGTVGSTGYSTGNHLHFQIRIKGSSFVDPLLNEFLNMPTNLSASGCCKTYINKANSLYSKVNITLNANGGLVNLKSSVVVSGTYGKTYALPVPKRTGYNFAGWYTASSGGSKVTSSTKISSTAHHALYARWTAKTVTVTFNGNLGSVSPGSKKVTYDSAYGTLPTPKLLFLKFDGWYTAKSGGTKVSSGTKVTATGNHTLYARWKLF